jgi:hypothetical protein
MFFAKVAGAGHGNHAGYGRHSGTQPHSGFAAGAGDQTLMAAQRVGPEGFDAVISRVGLIYFQINSVHWPA